MPQHSTSPSNHSIVTFFALHSFLSCLNILPTLYPSYRTAGCFSVFVQLFFLMLFVRATEKTYCLFFEDGAKKLSVYVSFGCVRVGDCDMKQ